MAKLRFPFLAALCFALVGAAIASVPTFIVQGRVYCDNCRAGFETSISTYMPGAKVKLECKHFETAAVEHMVEGVTDESGAYNIEVENDHEEEICEVVLIESKQEGCNEIPEGRDRARVLVSTVSGMASLVRFANSLGFLKAVPEKECGQILQQYALGVDG